MSANTGGKMIGRWSLITSVGLLILALASTESAKTNEAAPSSVSEPSKSICIHQGIDFTVSPEWLYETLLDSKRFSKFSGRKANIKREPGGAFSLFDGHIVGRNVELIPNTRIVQAWRVATWPEGVYSIVRFEFKPRESGTQLIFDHIGFPEGLHDHLAEGWETNYWALLRKAK